MNHSKSLGQHTLEDTDLLDRIVHHAAPTVEDIVFEIGTGHGNLTFRLCGRAGMVISCEIDRKAYNYSRQMLSKFKNIILIHGNAFKIKVDFNLLVSNLPYSQSSRFVEWLVTRNIKRAVVMVQEEFADKLLSQPGDRNYRSVTVVARSSFRIKVLERVPCSRFRPVPKVSSVLLLLEPKGRRLTTDEIRILKVIFSFRGRKLSSATREIAKRKGVKEDEILRKISNTSLAERVEKLEVQELVKLAGTLAHLPVKL